jgi:protoporphyrinogen oxidase
MSERYDILIIGAGISGLSMAHYCRQEGLKPLVLEKEERVGGSLHSQRFDGEEAAFWMELGAHSCFNSYGNLLAMLEDCHLLSRLQKKEKVGFRLWVDGMLQSIPSQLHVLELLGSLPHLLTQKKAGQSVADYYAKIVGPRNFAAVFSPAFDAVICQPSATFPADLLFRSKRRRRDILRSFTLPGGLQTITDALAEQAGLRVLTGQDIQALAFMNSEFIVSTAGGNAYAAPFLCLATPVDVAAELLQAIFPELAGLLARIRMVAVETVGVVVRKEVVNLPLLAGIIARDDCFFSVVSRDTVQHPCYRGFTFHFKPGLLDHAGKLKRIGQVLGSEPEQLVWVASKANDLPALTVGHGDLIRGIDRQIVGLPLALTGNYYTGVSIEDCVARSASEFSRLRDLRGFGSGGHGSRQAVEQ